MLPPGRAWHERIGQMNAFETIGTAMLLAQVGRQQLMAALAIKMSRFRHDALEWLKDVASSVRPI